MHIYWRVNRGKKVKKKIYIYVICPVTVLQRKIKQQLRAYRECWGWLVPFYIGWSQKASLIKRHFEQSPKGNEGASYVDIWERNILGERLEPWAILKYKEAKRDLFLLFSLPPLLSLFFSLPPILLPFLCLKLCKNKHHFKWAESRDTFNIIRAVGKIPLLPG